jgi:hypothetical protein
MRFRGRRRSHGREPSLERRAAAAAVLALAVVAAGCGEVIGEAPTANPEPFPGIATQLGRFGVNVLNWTAGDPGCDDPTLSPTSIRFAAEGLDQLAPVQLRIYIFRNREAWERRKPDVDSCAAAWAEDPGTFELIDQSPYVLAGQGPWAPGFEEAIRKGLGESAGNGG